MQASRAFRGAAQMLLASGRRRRDVPPAARRGESRHAGGGTKPRSAAEEDSEGFLAWSRAEHLHVTDGFLGDLAHGLRDTFESRLAGLRRGGAAPRGLGYPNQACRDPRPGRSTVSLGGGGGPRRTGQTFCSLGGGQQRPSELALAESLADIAGLAGRATQEATDSYGTTGTWRISIRWSGPR